MNRELASTSSARWASHDSTAWIVLGSPGGTRPPCRPRSVRVERGDERGVVQRGQRVGGPRDLPVVGVDDVGTPVAEPRRPAGRGGGWPTRRWATRSSSGSHGRSVRARSTRTPPITPSVGDARVAEREQRRRRGRRRPAPGSARRRGRRRHRPTRGGNSQVSIRTRIGLHATPTAAAPDRAGGRRPAHVCVSDVGSPVRSRRRGSGAGGCQRSFDERRSRRRLPAQIRCSTAGPPTAEPSRPPSHHGNVSSSSHVKRVRRPPSSGSIVNRPVPVTTPRVAHAHRPAGLPLGDLHAVGEAHRADLRDALEPRADARGLLGEEADRLGVGHPVDVAFDLLDGRARRRRAGRRSRAATRIRVTRRRADGAQRLGGRLGRHDVDHHAGAALEAGGVTRFGHRCTCQWYWPACSCGAVWNPRL